MVLELWTPVVLCAHHPPDAWLLYPPIEPASLARLGDVFLVELVNAEGVPKTQITPEKIDDDFRSHCL